MSDYYSDNAALNHSDNVSVHLEFVHQLHIPPVLLKDFDRFEYPQDFQESEQSGQAHQPQQLLVGRLLAG